MSPIRGAAGLVVVLSAAAAATAASGPRYTVPCSESIAQPRFPYVGSREPRYRYRLVLGAISVPPAYVGVPVALHERPWAAWLKAGVVVRADGRAVDIAVAPGWRGRAAVIWGSGERSPVGSLRIAGCRDAPSLGNAYAGGFLLAAPSACVPLVFRAGGRSATVRFGIGRRCP